MGSLVADFHRNLLKGGIYIYPKTTAAPLGRLRLIYECAPLAWIAEEAGGKATDKTKESGHCANRFTSKNTLFYWLYTMVEKAESYMNE